MTHYLSRLRLLREPGIAALKALIDPDNPAQAMDAHHRLVWSAFAGDPSSSRDFLWRAEGKGSFLVLSGRKPQAAGLFETPEVKVFAPDLQAGDRLRILLRVNATKTRPERLAVKANGKPDGRRVDIVMHALKDIPKGDARSQERMRLAQDAASLWLAAQGEKYGFRLEDCKVTDYSVQVLPRHRGKRDGQPQFGVLDISGAIEVSDPAAFLAKLTSGFGRAKAFGCGLMLIRRA